MSIESVIPSNHLILCHPFLLLPSIFPSIRVFINELALPIRWPKHWSFSISPSSEYSGLISFRESFRKVFYRNVVFGSSALGSGGEEGMLFNKQILGLRSAYSELQGYASSGRCCLSTSFPLHIPRVQNTQKHRIYNFWNNSPGGDSEYSTTFSLSLSLFFFFNHILVGVKGWFRLRVTLLSSSWMECPGTLPISICKEPKGL